MIQEFKVLSNENHGLAGEIFTRQRAACREKPYPSSTERLTPVTLDLGGKSPAIVCEDFDLRQAAERIFFTKFIKAPHYLHSHPRPNVG